MKRRVGLVLTIGILLTWSAQGVLLVPLKTPPTIASMLKPEVYARVQDKEIMTHAALDTVDASSKPELKKYSFYAAMKVGASVDQTRRVLTDYELYKKLVPYVDEAHFSKTSHILNIAGGIWKFKLRSDVLFEEKSDRWIHYRIIAGHFTGLEGDIFFEPVTEGEAGTLVYFSGLQNGRYWPPAFVIERGAEIVFGFTAKRMRSYIESQKLTVGGNSAHDDPSVPQPRRRLSQ